MNPKRDKHPVVPGTTSNNALGMLADEVVWHLNGHRADMANHILHCCEQLGIMLPPSRLTCSNLTPIMEYRKRMDARVDLADLRMREQAARDAVVYFVLGKAHADANPDPADPGWDSDYQEDQLRDAVIEYAELIEQRRSFGG